MQDWVRGGQRYIQQQLGGLGLGGGRSRRKLALACTPMSRDPKSGQVRQDHQVLRSCDLEPWCVQLDKVNGNGHHHVDVVASRISNTPSLGALVESLEMASIVLGWY